VRQTPLFGEDVIGNPIFTEVRDQEKKEIEEKLIIARQQLYKSKQGKPRTSIWMNIFCC